MKIVLIGAGSAMFTRGLVADLIQRGEEMELALVDVDPAALAVAEGLASKMIRARKAPVQLTGSVDRRAVLKDATAVICTVGVGGRRAWEQDVFIPRRYGINQPVGDTVGPGGTSRALRMVPAMVDVARDVLDLAPEALFFNYGNPMAPVCRAIRKATGAPVVGLCHGVFHVGHYLADALGVERSDFRYTAIGINHLTWFVEARARGRDAMPHLHEIAAQRLSPYLSLPGTGPQNSPSAAPATPASGGKTEGAPERVAPADPTRDNPFSWHLFQLFGAFPAVLDRHVTEFFPQFFANGSYYGKTLGVDAYSFERTIAGGDRIFEAMRQHALSAEPLGEDYFRRTGGEHEQVTDIIDSIRSDRGTIYSANLPNTGQVPNLPAGAIVESPAVAEAGGVRPIAQPPLPAGVVGTLATRFQWVETVVEAALERSREKFIQALVLDGAVRSLDTAARLADDLLAVQATYLPDWV